MRLAVLSDIHGNVVALDAVLADLKRHSPDLIVNLGDCVTSPLWPRETFERLQALSARTVRGNHDRYLGDAAKVASSPTITFAHDALLPAHRETLVNLPSTLAIDDGVFACHGTPANDTEYLLEEKVDGRLALATSAKVSSRLEGVGAGLVLCGHSHDQHLAAAGNRLILNPGSVGCPRYADEQHFTRAEAGSPHARYAIATRRGARWSIDMFALEYDWSVVVERARQNGREDWAVTFLGG